MDGQMTIVTLTDTPDGGLHVHKLVDAYIK
jgi:hypothetical protein